MTVDRYKGKKTSISIPQDVYQKIESLAVTERRSVSQQIVILCEQALESTNEGEALKFLQKLIKGERPSNAQVIILAHALEVDTELLLDLVNNKEAKC